MENLKIRFELNGLKFEIDGDEKVVRDEFKEFKEFTQSLVEKINLTNDQSLKQNQQLLDNVNQMEENPINNDFPLLKDIILQNLPQSEFEWIVIYAFYNSGFGTKEFTRESLQEKYKETGRYSSNRSKKFAENFKALVSKRLIKSKNENEYILLEEGKRQAIEILTREKKAYTAKKNPSIIKPEGHEKRNVHKSVPASYILKDLDLRPDGKESLRDFAKKYVIESAEELYLVVVYYLKSILQLEKVTVNHILTSIDDLDKKIPSHLKQVLINMRNGSTNGWLILDDLENISFSIRGMNHMKHDILKTNMEINESSN
jgi:hypothetical protein